MSQGRRKHRVPTSEELEREGALSPPADRTAGGRRSVLRRFFRASRFRVSEDVAARKHVGTSAGQATSEPTRAPASSEDREQAGQLSSAAQVTDRAGDTARRRIRIDPSVKQRRGLDRSHKQ